MVPLEMIPLNKSHSGRFRYTDVYSSICRHFQNPVHPWCIQNPGIFRTLAYSGSESYSEPSQKSTIERFVKIANGYNYFRNISFSRYLLYEISIVISFFNTALTFAPEVFILCKIPICCNIQINWHIYGHNYSFVLREQSSQSHEQSFLRLAIFAWYFLRIFCLKFRMTSFTEHLLKYL